MAICAIHLRGEFSESTRHGLCLLAARNFALPSFDPDPVPEVAGEVLDIFLRAPLTVDTVAGITKWRYLQHKITFTVEQVSDAIEWLVSQGYLLRDDETPDSLFRLNVLRMREAQRFMQSAPSRRATDQRPVARLLERIPDPDSALTPQVLAWLDAVLNAFVRGHASETGEHPGLTRGYASILALLGPGPRPNADIKEVTERSVAAGAALDHALNHSDPRVSPLAAVTHRLGLTRLELHALLLCLAPELDAKYETIFGFLNDDLGRRTATLGLVCRVLGEPLAIRNALADTGALTAWRLVGHGPLLPYADEPLRIDQAVVSWLLGRRGMLLDDPRVAPFVRAEPWPGGDWLLGDDAAEWIRTIAQRFMTAGASGGVERAEVDTEWLVLAGEDSATWRALLEAASSDVGLPLVRFSVPAMIAVNPADAHDLCARLARAVVLSDAVPVLDAGDLAMESQNLAPVAELIAALTRAGHAGIVIAPGVERIVGMLPRTGCRVIRRETAGHAALSVAFVTAAAEAGLRVDPGDAERLAAAFPLALDAIDQAVRLAAFEGAADADPSTHASALSAACRRVASPELPRFARRIQPVFSLKDVVLPADRCEQLREIVAHVRYAAQVLHTWGLGAQLPYGRGVAALFTGPSGTGKTMAAQAIAAELGTDTYVVDLSRVVSKYIGESEKNIDVAFRDAQRAGAVLQIDEAEALFGKRSETREAHDRYANIEIAYLLQRMEAFEGVAILTTNLRQNLDQAFLRRLRFVVEFPRPDAEAREAMWRSCLPATASFIKDLDLRFLARHLELTGGNIRQIAVRAAFAAASEPSEAIEMKHVLAATRAELLKLGMQGAEHDVAAFEQSRRASPARVA